MELSKVSNGKHFGAPLAATDDIHDARKGLDICGGQSCPQACTRRAFKDCAGLYRRVRAFRRPRRLLLARRAGRSALAERGWSCCRTSGRRRLCSALPVFHAQSILVGRPEEELDTAPRTIETFGRGAAALPFAFARMTLPWITALRCKALRRPILRRPMRAHRRADIGLERPGTASNVRSQAAPTAARRSAFLTLAKRVSG